MCIHNFTLLFLKRVPKIVKLGPANQDPLRPTSVVGRFGDKTVGPSGSSRALKEHTSMLDRGKVCPLESLDFPDSPLPP